MVELEVAAASASSVWGTLPHHALGPLRVFNGTLDEAARACLLAATSGVGGRVATANLDFVAQALRNAQLRADLEASTLVVADGAPVARLARVVGARRIRGRIAGVDLVRALCSIGAAAGGLRIALYGSDTLTAHRARRWIETLWPANSVVLVLTPPFRALTAQEAEGDRRAIAEAAPELVLVALGCPAQERRIAEYFDSAPHAVWVGVGGTLDFFSGRRRRAPGWMRAAGMEWLFRLLQEPKRLWRRYLRDVPALAALGWWCVGTRLRSVAPGRMAHARPFNAESTGVGEGDERTNRSTGRTVRR